MKDLDLHVLACYRKAGTGAFHKKDDTRNLCEVKQHNLDHSKCCRYIPRTSSKCTRREGALKAHREIKAAYFSVAEAETVTVENDSSQFVSRTDV
jgi:hypothetical protein